MANQLPSIQNFNTEAAQFTTPVTTHPEQEYESIMKQMIAASDFIMKEADAIQLLDPMTQDHASVSQPITDEEQPSSLHICMGINPNAAYTLERITKNVKVFFKRRKMQ